MRIRRILIPVMFFSFVFIAFTTFAFEVELIRHADPITEGYFCKMSEDIHGNLHAICQDHGVLKYMYAPAGGWFNHVEEVPDVVTRPRFWEADVAADSHGNVYIFCDSFDAQTMTLIKKNADTQTWEGPWVVLQAYGGGYISVAMPRMVIDKNDNIHLVFGRAIEGFWTTRAVMSSDGGYNWSQETDMGAGGYHQIATDSLGRVHVIRFRELHPNYWLWSPETSWVQQGDIDIVEPTGYDGAFVDTSPDGSPHFTWQPYDYIAFVDPVYVYQKDDGEWTYEKAGDLNDHFFNTGDYLCFPKIAAISRDDIVIFNALAFDRKLRFSARHKDEWIYDTEIDVADDNAIAVVSRGNRGVVIYSSGGVIKGAEVVYPTKPYLYAAGFWTTNFDNDREKYIEIVAVAMSEGNDIKEVKGTLYTPEGSAEIQLQQNYNNGGQYLWGIKIPYQNPSFGTYSAELKAVSEFGESDTWPYFHISSEAAGFTRKDLFDMAQRRMREITEQRAANMQGGSHRKPEILAAGWGMTDISTTAGGPLQIAIYADGMDSPLTDIEMYYSQTKEFIDLPDDFFTEYDVGNFQKVYFFAMEDAGTGLPEMDAYFMFRVKNRNGLWSDLWPTRENVPTPTPTNTPTNTPTYTPTPNPTNTPTFTPTITPVPPTNTPVPPTNTPEFPTSTPVPPTDTPVPPTDTPTPGH